jgi:carbamoyl-phosphate synthase small subunit
MERVERNGKGILLLEDGTFFEGEIKGAKRSVSGEVVFNTGMVGYPESLTDPSYYGQILVFTYPLIGNYGISNIENYESDKIQVKALILSSICEKPSHWSRKKNLEDWLEEEGIPALTGIPTRTLTKILREKGTMLGKIIYEGEEPDFYDPNKENIVKEVSCKEIYEYGKGNKKIVLIDCGVKRSIIRALVGRGLKVIRVPWDYDFKNIDFDGIVISNGPGDPKMCDKTIENVKKLLEDDKPILGICLGHQILALSAGMETYKLKYGHRDQNQPCIELKSKRCYITSQNHGFAVLNEGKDDWEIWFLNANDGTIEGIRHKKKPFLSVQFHPEGFPGPKDTEFVFDEFLNLLKRGKN